MLIAMPPGVCGPISLPANGMISPALTVIGTILPYPLVILADLAYRAWTLRGSAAAASDR